MDDLSRKFKLMQDFLNEPKVKAFVEEDDLDGVYHTLRNDTFLDISVLTKYLVSLGIQPLDFVTTIPDEMFSRVYRDDPVCIQIPQTVKQIGDYAFYKCKSITQLTIPKSVREIGFGAFIGCTSLTGLKLENGDVTFDEMVFEHCPFVIVYVPAGSKCIKYLQESNVKYVEV